MNYFKSFDEEKISYQIQNQPAHNNGTVVLIHGFGGDPNFLIPFINELIKLTPQKKIISYNLRGHGASSMKFTQKTKSFEESHAKDLQALLTHLEIANPILIGHSLGGIALQEYLIRKLLPQPQKNILICTTTHLLGFSPLKKIFFEILKKLPDLKDHPKEKPVNFHLQFTTSSDINLKRFINDTKISGGLGRWLMMMGSLLGWKNKSLTSLNNKNCYYIYGNKDIIAPAFIQEKNLKNLNKINKIIINSNHISPITSTKELAQIVSELV